MNTIPRSLDASQSTYSTAFEQALSLDVLQEKVPAAFAPSAHERLTASYGFVQTAQVLDALRQAGFRPVEARQTRTRIASQLHARHLIRLRRLVEVIGVGDATPELLLLNSHDGTSGVQLRAGLFRAVCSNGLIASVATFPVWRALHRGHVLDDVVRAALEMSERFGVLAAAVERMERTHLEVPDRLEFAAEALALRFPEDRGTALRPSEVLVPQRQEDVGDDLWRVYNVIQGRLLRGGLLRRSPSNRLTRTRQITSIREDLRLNSALWDMAMMRAA